MKRTNLLAMAALAAVVTLTSCGKGDDEEVNDGRVRFTSAIAVQPNEAVSRAAGKTWNNGDVIGIYMVDNGTTNVSMGAANNPFTATDAGVLTAVVGNEIYYPQVGAVDFIAYYPRKATGAGGIDNDLYPVNVSNQSSQADIDLLWAKATGVAGAGYTKTNAGAVGLTFSHKLAKLILNISAGDGITSLAGTTISVKGMNTVNTFHVMTGDLGATPGTPAAIAPKKITDGVKYEAILLPYIVPSPSHVAAEFTVGNDVFVWEVPDGTTFEAGKEHTWNITISRTGVSVTATITDWTTGPGGTGTAN